MAWSISLGGGAGSPIAQAVVATLGLVGAAPIVGVQSGGGGGPPGGAYDYFISPTGSNSNPGTMSAPWAITGINTKQSIYAGKSVGIIEGTYGVSSLMSTNEATPALTVNGGTSAAAPTFIGPCTATGAYAPGTAVLQANDNGIYGGGNSNASPIMGINNSVANRGYLTIDGLAFEGYSLWAVHVGNSPGGGVLIVSPTIQNCTFTNQVGTNSTVASGVNLASIVNYGSTSLTIFNCWGYNNVGYYGVDRGHFSFLYQWGLASNGNTTATVLRQCTLVNTGGWHGKEGGQNGVIVDRCFVDWSAGPDGQNGSGVQGFDGAPTSGYTLPSSITNSIIVSDCQFLDLQSELGNGGWSTPLLIENNTFIAPNGISIVGVDWYEAAAGTKLLTYINNIQVGTPGGYGYFLVNADAFALIDYNLYSGGALWTTVPAGNHTSSGATSHTSLTSWQSAVGGDAHSITTAPTFTNAGSYALQYTTTTGSAYQAGRVGGLSSGAPINLGAWDGNVTQIGCTFAT